MKTSVVDNIGPWFQIGWTRVQLTAENKNFFGFMLKKITDFINRLTYKLVKILKDKNRKMMVSTAAFLNHWDWSLNWTKQFWTRPKKFKRIINCWFYTQMSSWTKIFLENGTKNGTAHKKGWEPLINSTTNLKIMMSNLACLRLIKNQHKSMRIVSLLLRIPG